MIHYNLPYRWQVFDGVKWNDLSKMEEIERAYCDPKNSSFADRNISFQSMTCSFASVRRLSTPSSVTKPSNFVMTTKWLWYWKNDLGQWIGYGEEDGKHQSSTLSSDDLENLYLADPTGVIQFQAGSQLYEINFKEMTQRNMHYQTPREVRRRPKFVSSEDVEKKKGQTNTARPTTPQHNYPTEWDKSALPELGYKPVTGWDSLYGCDLR
uniref:WWE domain-containing protein n=1 Tax=Sphenodon punctatus TaxID=8508 RepID=A0A8D0GA51_SPHPU